MVISDRGTAKMQSSLNLPNAQWSASFEQKPIDFPSLAPESILKLVLVRTNQTAKRLSSTILMSCIKDQLLEHLFIKLIPFAENRN